MDKSDECLVDGNRLLSLLLLDGELDGDLLVGVGVERRLQFGARRDTAKRDFM